MLVPVLLIFGGYSLASYGWVLLQGWDIPARQWFSPLHPYQFTAGQEPAKVPAGQVFPGAANKSKGDGSAFGSTGNEFKVTPGEMRV